MPDKQSPLFPVPKIGPRVRRRGSVEIFDADRNLGPGIEFVVTPVGDVWTVFRKIARRTNDFAVILEIMIKFLSALLVSVSTLVAPALAAVTQNPRLSLKKTVYASPASNAASLTDGKFGSPWTYSANAWAAFNVGSGPTKVLISWNDPTGNWSDSVPSAGVCQKGTTFPTGYKISTSANSTNGSDGTWTPQATVTKNVVSARSHQIPFDGASWVKIEVSGGSGSMDEIEVFDASNGIKDSWFFLGTSISQMTYKSFVVDSNFSDLVHARFPGNTPAMVRGGVPCINSSNLVASLSRYLDLAAPNHYLAIEMGTNDGYNNGTSNLATFKKNIQTLIDSAKARGMEPIVARVLSTDSSRAKWQIDKSYPLAVDNLQIQNNLIAGPDLDGWFRAHPSELGSDGIHPTAAGAQSIQRLWAETMAKNLYGKPAKIATFSTTRALSVHGSFDALGRSQATDGPAIRVKFGPVQSASEIVHSPF